MKTVLITGGSRGIGRAAVELFLEKGYKVLFIYRASKQQAEQLEELGAVGYRADLSLMEECARVAELILKEQGGVDVLINNAGISHFSLFTDLKNDEWKRVCAVNLDAPIYLTRAFLPHMIGQKWGRIVNISSMWGQVGSSCEVAYSTAKAGLIGFTKALAKEEGPSGITVNCICPGLIDTEMNQTLDEETIGAIVSETPLMRVGRPEDVASCCLYLASKQASFITGQIIGVNGGLVIT
ncbi:MAG: 3-oxoacyl-ACP reductase FabG [Clostridia bacterium]|nr:3-oxoacyl-ACP reductase FabG [Clostridia bacterium]